MEDCPLLPGRPLSGNASCRDGNLDDTYSELIAEKRRNTGFLGTLASVEEVRFGREKRFNQADPRLLEAFGFQTIFGRSDVQTALGLKLTRSTAPLTSAHYGLQ